MTIFRTMAAAAVTLALLAACTREMKTSFAVGEGSIPLSEGVEASLSYSYQVEYVTGGLDKEVMERINATLVSQEILTGREDGGSDVPAACKHWAEGLEAGYQEDASGFLDELDAEGSWMFNWEYRLSGEFSTACPERRLRTYSSFYSEYTGGAHGLSGNSYTVFDMTSGEVVRQEDLFREGFEEDGRIAGLLLERVLQALREQDFEDALMGNPYPNGNFSVDREGVTWHYNPYEVAVYAAGQVEARLSWKELAPYLK